MRIINNTSFSPSFNLASEEYLMRETEDEIFMLWRNSPAVIIGKNQNAWREVNVSYTEENNIKVIRRMSGGGAVFHDLGNINFTFITFISDKDETRVLDFSYFTKPVIEALTGLGLEARLDGRNDIICENVKISGNAQCVYPRPDGRKILLHHGTLLFGADLDKLALSLNVNAEKIKSKGIKSVKSRVLNIRTLLSEDMSTEEFYSYLIKNAENNYGVTAASFSNEEIIKIQQLDAEKYSTWEWNFGKSPNFDITCEKRYPFGSVSVMYSTENGIITSIDISGDFFGTENAENLSNSLAGVKLNEAEIMKRLSAPDTPDVGKAINGCTPQIIVDLIMNN